MNDLFVNGQKDRSTHNKSRPWDIDLLSPGENFSISDHFTNFSWPIVRWYKKNRPFFDRKIPKNKISYFFNKYGGFYLKNLVPKNHPDQSDILLFDDFHWKHRKKNFSTVTLSSTNSGLPSPYKYLAHGRGTCKVHLFAKKWQKDKKRPQSTLKS